MLKSENSFAILVEPSDEETTLSIEVWYEQTQEPKTWTVQQSLLD